MPVGGRNELVDSMIWAPAFVVAAEKKKSAFFLFFGLFATGSNEVISWHV